MSPKRTDDLGDLTVHGIWEAHLKGEFVPAGVEDDVAVRAAGVLAEKGYWTWMFQAATEDLTSWDTRRTASDELETIRRRAERLERLK